MSEDELKPKTGETSAEFKSRLNQKIRESKAKTDIKESSLPINGMIAHEINASASEEPTKNSRPETTPGKDEVKPDPRTAAATPVEDRKQSPVDLLEWAKKKGINWTTEESVLAGLRKSDQEYHKWKEKQVQPSFTPPPMYQPPAPSYPPPPQNYQPPQPPNRAFVENMARQYNMLPDDFERFFALNKDFFEVAMRAEREKWDREMTLIKREGQKNSVFRDLSSDPVFRRPEVGAEFHHILDEMQTQDAQAFEDPNAYKRAYDKALINIARRNLEGHPLEEGIPPQVPMNNYPPMTPPRPLGQGSAGGALENENELNMDQWNKLNPAEKRQWFKERGLISTY